MPPTLHELLPLESQVPVPFSLCRVGCRSLFSRQAPQDDETRLTGASVMAVYTPSGDIGDQGVHLGCRVTRVQVGDEEYGTVGDHHTAVLRNAFDGKGAESVFTDWVTTETVETTACGHRRTRHWHRRPLIHRHPGTTEVDRPVADQAFVIQSTSWGLVETCAYLAPDPEEGRARKVSVTVADRVMRQVSEYPAPEPTTRLGTETE